MSGMIVKQNEAPSYVTKDGSLIREIIHPALHGNRNQSLAEARVAPGSSTHAHVHDETEEIYHVLGGTAMMSLGQGRFRIEPGDTVLIPPGTEHVLENDGTEELVILCSCSPAYSHDDTRITNPG